MAQKLYEESNIQAIADAIREKNGESTTYKTSEMAAAITAITTGGGGDSGIPEEAFVITGDCSYRFAYDGWNWFIEQYGNQITTKDMTNITNLFRECKNLEEIPFEINIVSNVSSMSNLFQNCSKLKTIPNIYCNHSKYVDMGYMFSNDTELEDLPYFYNAYPGNMASFFSGTFIKTIPEDYFDTWDFSRMNSYSSANCNSLFSGAKGLRNIPKKIFSVFRDVATSSNYSCFYYNVFYNCGALDEIVDFVVLTKTFNSNIFNSTFQGCRRVKNIIFETNDDGTPKTANWKSQTIDLANDIGYFSTLNTFMAYSRGIDINKEVKDDTTYQALKNDPDWFATNVAYSRYNHDSVVATINSLPDTSAYLDANGGTNTIKFKGVAGSSTDGGAINTLTPEEIAVATAKGWTVSIS